MSIVMKIYKKFYKTRRWTSGLLASALIVKNGFQHLFPTYGFMPFDASTKSSQFSLEHSVWLLQSVKSDMEIDNDILMYVTTQPDVAGAGFFAIDKFKQPCSIGIPKNYFCSNIFELEDLNVHIQKKRIGGTSSNEVQLMEALLISHRAQKYGVARCLVYFKKNWALLQTFLPSSFVGFGYILCFHGTKLFFRNRKVSMILVLQFTVASILVTWLLYKVTKALVKNSIDKSLDKSASGISKEYALGGIEYYQKICKRNQAWRILQGKKGRNHFTVFGNIRDGIFFNSYGPPFTERIEMLKKTVDSFG